LTSADEQCIAAQLILSTLRYSASAATPNCWRTFSARGKGFDRKSGPAQGAFLTTADCPRKFPAHLFAPALFPDGHQRGAWPIRELQPRPFRQRPTVMQQLFTDALRQRIRQAKIIAVVVIDRPEDAVPLARALLQGGVTAIELTLRTPAAFAALARIRESCPEMLAGLGTVLEPEQVTKAVAGGAAFGVAPGCNPAVVRAAAAAGLPFAPGILTPSDVETAIALGGRTVKFFPAEPSGGVAYLKALAAPYAHLGVEYLPLGGLTLDNFTRYLELDCVPAVGGSWLASREAIRKQDWATIAENARAALARLA